MTTLRILPPELPYESRQKESKEVTKMDSISSDEPDTPEGNSNNKPTRGAGSRRRSTISDADFLKSLLGLDKEQEWEEEPSEGEFIK